MSDYGKVKEALINIGVSVEEYLDRVVFCRYGVSYAVPNRYVRLLTVDKVLEKLNEIETVSEEIEQHLMASKEEQNERPAKNDELDNKPRIELIPMDIVLAMGRVMAFGCDKYWRDSWKEVSQEKWNAAMYRHDIAHRDGEIYDKESGFNHAVHTLANAWFALWHEIHTKGNRVHKDDN